MGDGEVAILGGLAETRTISLSTNERYMTLIKISGDEMEGIVEEEFKTYERFLLNYANRYSHGTRSNIVGQISELSKEFREENPEGTLEDWIDFYLEKQGRDGLEEATEKIHSKVKEFEEVASGIDEDTARRWVEELVFIKSFEGLMVAEEAILKKLSEKIEVDYRNSTPEEESKGIDGYLGDQPISIKRETYASKDEFEEEIHAPIVYYEIQDGEIELDISELIETLG